MSEEDREMSAALVYVIDLMVVFLFYIVPVVVVVGLGLQLRQFLVSPPAAAPAEHASDCVDVYTRVNDTHVAVDYCGDGVVDDVVEGSLCGVLDVDCPPTVGHPPVEVVPWEVGVCLSAGGSRRECYDRWYNLRMRELEYEIGRGEDGG